VSAPAPPGSADDRLTRAARPDAEADARVVATGRNDFPNQLNNLLVFPGLFRGVLDVRARTATAALMRAGLIVAPGTEGRPEGAP
jgi:malic enzyme